MPRFEVASFILQDHTCEEIKKDMLSFVQADDKNALNCDRQFHTCAKRCITHNAVKKTKAPEYEQLSQSIIRCSELRLKWIDVVY